MLLLVVFEKMAVIRFVPELTVLYVNVAPVKMADDKLAFCRIQLIMRAFVKFTLDKSDPVKS